MGKSHWKSRFVFFIPVYVVLRFIYLIINPQDATLWYQYFSHILFETEGPTYNLPYAVSGHLQQQVLHIILTYFKPKLIRDVCESLIFHVIGKIKLCSFDGLLLALPATHLHQNPALAGARENRWRTLVNLTSVCWKREQKQHRRK